MKDNAISNQEFDLATRIKAELERRNLLTECEKALQQAVSNEKYSDAAIFKNRITNILNNPKEITNLIYEREQATAKEDYAKAAVLNNKIVKIVNGTAQSVTESQSVSNNQSSQNIQSEVSNDTPVDKLNNRDFYKVNFALMNYSFYGDYSDLPRFSVTGQFGYFSNNNGWLTEIASSSANWDDGVKYGSDLIFGGGFGWHVGTGGHFNWNASLVAGVLYYSGSEYYYFAALEEGGDFSGWDFYYSISGGLDLMLNENFGFNVQISLSPFTLLSVGFVF